jgi:chromosome segregation ATPase
VTPPPPAPEQPPTAEEAGLTPVIATPSLAERHAQEIAAKNALAENNRAALRQQEAQRAAVADRIATLEKEVLALQEQIKTTRGSRDLDRGSALATEIDTKTQQVKKLRAYLKQISP